MQPAPSHPLDLSDGRRALALAAGFADPSSLQAATALRREFAPELAASAAGQAALRLKARAKFGDQASTLLFTPTGLEQATRPVVSQWRAEQLLQRGVRQVFDLGCGLGFDALTLARAGLDVVAVERDELTAAAARHNLAAFGVPVWLGSAEDAAELWAGAGIATAIFLDPARRAGQARSWKLSDLSPSWEFVESLAHGPQQIAVKLGPGVDRGALPGDLDRVWVSDHGDVVEASLFSPTSGRPAEVSAVLIGADARHEFARPLAGLDDAPPPIGPLGGFIHEADGALSRSQLLPAWLDEHAPGLRLIDPRAGYLTSDDPVVTPWLRSYRVIDRVGFSVGRLRDLARAHDLGVLEIKKRGVELDPAPLRRQLKLKGSGSGTVLIMPTPDGPTAVLAQPV